MAKTKEELSALKEEVEAVGGKLHALTDDELAQVSGGMLYFSGNLKISDEVTVSALCDIPHGTQFYGFFDGNYCLMQRTNKHGFDGVTVFTNKGNTYYPLNGSDGMHVIDV